jgi:hypothetical protein
MMRIGGCLELRRSGLCAYRTPMIRELRIWWRLRPLVNRFLELTKMKFSLNVAIQMLALVAQGLNASVDLLPGRGKFWAMVGLSAVQGLTAVLAHFANPDGTPAQAPYIKK